MHKNLTISYVEEHKNRVSFGDNKGELILQLLTWLASPVIVKFH